MSGSVYTVNAGIYKEGDGAAAGLAYLEENGEIYGEMKYVCIDMSCIGHR